MPCGCSACCVGLDTEHGKAEASPRVFVSGGRLAAVGEHLVSFYELPAGSSVTVGGASALGPMALSGALKITPPSEPVKVLAFSEPIARPRDPEQNSGRFLVCTGAGQELPTPKSGFKRFCGVMDVTGGVVYQAPRPAQGGFAEALALAAGGDEALFLYGRGKTGDHYLIWKRGGPAKTLKADLHSAEVRDTLKRFGQERYFEP